MCKLNSGCGYVRHLQKRCSEGGLVKQRTKGTHHTFSMITWMALDDMTMGADPHLVEGDRCIKATKEEGQQSESMESRDNPPSGRNTKSSHFPSKVRSPIVTRGEKGGTSNAKNQGNVMIGDLGAKMHGDINEIFHAKDPMEILVETVEEDCGQYKGLANESLNDFLDELAQKERQQMGTWGKESMKAILMKKVGTKGQNGLEFRVIIFLPCLMWKKQCNMPFLMK